MAQDLPAAGGAAAGAGLPELGCQLLELGHVRHCFNLIATAKTCSTAVSGELQPCCTSGDAACVYVILSSSFLCVSGGLMMTIVLHSSAAIQVRTRRLRLEDEARACAVVRRQCFTILFVILVHHEVCTVAC
jgi:hypothetical protein